MQPTYRVDPVRVHRNNMRMLQPCQCLRLARASPRYLERHRTIRQLTLLCQKYPRERPAAQFLDEHEVRDRLARFRKRASRDRRTPVA